MNGNKLRAKIRKQNLMADRKAEIISELMENYCVSWWEPDTSIIVLSMDGDVSASDLLAEYPTLLAGCKVTTSANYQRDCAIVEFMGE